MAWQDVSPALRGALNEAAARTVEVVLRAGDHVCWRCRRPDQVPMVLHLAEDDATFDDAFEAFDPDVLAYVRDLLTETGHPAAATIGPRYSRTARARYLSLGCAACDALYGHFPLSEDHLALQVEGRLTDLPIMGTWHRPAIEWWTLQGLRSGP